MSNNNENKISLCKIKDLQREILQFETIFQHKFGLSLNEGMALCTLSSEKELTCGALCEKLSLSPSNTSKIISHLEKRGFVTREFGETDKRQMIFSLTKTGETILQKIEDASFEIPEHLSKIIL